MLAAPPSGGHCQCQSLPPPYSAALSCCSRRARSSAPNLRSGARSGQRPRPAAAIVTAVLSGRHSLPKLSSIRDVSGTPLRLGGGGPGAARGCSGARGSFRQPHCWASKADRLGEIQSAARGIPAVLLTEGQFLKKLSRT
ncbi:hypothetical protein H8959_005354 [Pygathrix nigripes]